MSVPLFLALYYLEAGLFFSIAPWTRLWTLNPLFQSNLTVSLIAANPFVRGFVTGFGVVHLLIGIHDLVRIARMRRREQWPQ
ncbi:MAG TPA: hypothetical protein VKH35_05520 [Thermoanaerobaculia bacterium]|nr:hypothetical protein [Thermoanaerobaculia bacterium]